MKKLIFLFLIFNHSSLISQSQFQWAVGGTDGDRANSIVQTTDGGYAVAGTTYSFGAASGNIYVVKLNSGGAIQWSRTIGGTGVEQGYSIKQTADGGYAVAGYTNSFGAGNGDAYIIKLDGSGTLQWNRTVGGASNDYGYSIVQAGDGGYAVAGYTYSFGAGNVDAYIVKLDGSGALQWSRAVGGITDDYAYSIIQTADGGYAVAGISNSFGAGNFDIYIIKLNSGGTIQWTRTVGGTGIDYGYSIVQSADGGYAAAGYTLSFGAGSRDFYIVKLDGSGALQWSRTMGGSNFDYAYSLIPTSAGGYAAAGWTYSFGAGLSDMYVVTLDGGGTFQWGKTLGGVSDDGAYCIIQTTDGGYAVAGGTNTFATGSNDDMYIVKLDATGNTCGNSSSPSSISGSGGTLGTPASSVATPTPTVTAPTPTIGTGGMLATICVIGIRPISNEIPNSYQLYQNYPNPFNPTTVFSFQLPVFGYVKFNVYDVLGKEIATLVNEEMKPGAYEIQWDASNYPSGVYFYRLEAGDGAFSSTKKMALTR